MALEDILNSIEKDTKNQLEDLSKKTNAEAEDIIKKAEAKAKVYIDNKIQKARLEAKSAEIRELSRKRMELKRKYYEELNRTILHAKQLITDSISEFRNTDTYKNLLNVLYKRIIDSLGNECEIIVLKDDVPLINFDKSVKVVKSSDMNGGLIGKSNDKLREIDYTIESIIDIAESDLIVSLSEVISSKTESTK